MAFGESCQTTVILLFASSYFHSVACAKQLFGRKMFYSNNLLNVPARSCKENAVPIAEAYKISLFDLLHLNSLCLKNIMFWDYFTDTVLFITVICYFSNSYYISVYCVRF